LKFQFSFLLLILPVLSIEIFIDKIMWLFY